MQRQILQAITADRGATDPERTLAAALLRVDHRPRAEDVLLVQAVADDALQPPPVRVVADVLADLVHVPGPPDRER
jgi:hypothetical protein